MSHTINEKQNLLLRAKRIRGQVEALVRTLDEERDCSEVLQVMSAARGAMNSLMAELLEGHWTGGGGGGANSCTGSDGASGGGGAASSWATSSGGSNITFSNQGSSTSTSCGQSTAVGTSLDSGAGGATTSTNGSNSFSGCAGNITLSWTLNASPSLSASGPSSATIGTAIAASAISVTLSGGSSPTGTITFTVFGPGGEPSSCTSGGTVVGTAPVAGNATYGSSAGYTPTQAGDYWWYASYGGDGNNNACIIAVWIGNV